jgi:hypothetical protein
VDNDSQDGSADVLEAAILRKGYERWAGVLRLSANRGFSAGNNAALRLAWRRQECDTFLLLNSDAQLRPGALAALLACARDHPDAGLVGPRLEFPDGTRQVSCFRDVSPLSELLSAAATGPLARLVRGCEVPISNPRPGDMIDWLSFACVLIRREVLSDVGLLDERYFMFYEDVDFCRRARRAGWRLVHCAAASVVHLQGASTPSSLPAASLARRPPRRPRCYYASRARYLATNYGVGGLWLANLLWWLGRSISWLRERAGGKQPHTAQGEALDIWTAALHPLGRASPVGPSGLGGAP